MHDLRSAAVNNTRLACACVGHRLHVFLRFLSRTLYYDQALFVRGLQGRVKTQFKTLEAAQTADGSSMEVSFCFWRMDARY